MVHPTTVADAVAALVKRGAVPLAGATDLIPSIIRKRELAPTALVNLKGIPGLSGIERVRGGVRIGALTTVEELLRSDIIREELALLAEVAHGFGSVQIRNLATIGGNLCNAAPSADLALPLLALEARLAARGPGGSRAIEIADFFLGANRTALRRGEILTAIVVSKQPAHSGAAFAKLGVRQAMDLTFVGVAAAVQLAPQATLAPGGGECRRARIALGAVAPSPMRARRAEAALEGAVLTGEAIARAAAAAAAESRPISDLRASKEYRREMTEVLTRRALHEAVRRAGKESR
jgi:carbon-monoxide dehydrogenase medium subunit